LELIAERCITAGVEFSVGLSPFELYANYDAPAQLALQDKVNRIVDLGVGGLAILFDDMPGNHAQLAERQAEICADVNNWTSGAALALRVCPTYYSDDPILDRVFGPRPDAYLPSLCEKLDDRFEVFWTGPAVCSQTVRPDDIAPVAEISAGRLALWDNYPVNDSRARSPHLYMQAITGRSRDLSAQLCSHWCNAMNQAALSLPALASLPKLYGRAAPAAPRVFEAAGLTPALISACEVLSEHTRESLTHEQAQRLTEAASHASPAARELYDWLQGGYEFDPACLTD
jgi:hypothetical protein